MKLIFLLSLIVMYLGIYSRLLNYSENKKSDSLILSGALSLILISIISNGLAVFNHLSLMSLDVVLSAAGICLCIHRNFKKNVLSVRYVGTATYKKCAVGMLLIVLLFLFYYCFVISPMMMADSQVYFYKAITYAESGSIKWPVDEFLQNNFDKYKDIINITSEAYSGYDFGISNNPGEGVVTGLHLFSCLLTAGYLNAGVTGINITVAVLGVFGVLCIFVFAKQIFGFKTSLCAAILCAVCPAQIYCSRTTLSETLNQILLWSAFYFIIKGSRKLGLKWGILGVGLLGLANFNRIDSYIWGCTVYAVGIWMLLTQKDRNKLKYNLYTVAAYTVVSVLGIVYAFVFSYPYFIDHIRLGVIPAILGLNGFLLLIMIIVLLFKSKIVVLTDKLNEMFDAICTPKIALLVTLGLGVVFYFLYAIRPILETSKDLGEIFAAEAFVQFCFYTSFLAIPFMLYGIYCILTKWDKMSIEHAMLFLGTGLANLLIYIVSPNVANRHYWAGRRWVVICIPFVFLLACFGLSELYKKKKIVSVTVISLIGIYVLLQGRSILFRAVNENVYEDLTSLSDTLDDEQVYFSADKRLVTTLRGVFGKKNIYRLKDDADDEIYQYLKDNQYLFYIGSNFIEPDKYEENENIYTQLCDRKQVVIESAEDTINEIPGKIEALKKTYNIYMVYYSEKGYCKEYEKYINPDIKDVIFNDMFKMSSMYDKGPEGKCVSNGEADFLMYGPYISLTKGKYELQLDLSLAECDNFEIGYIDIIGEQASDASQISLLGKEIKKEMFTNKTYSMTMPFEVKENLEMVECRFYVYDNVYLTVEDIKIKMIK